MFQFLGWVMDTQEFILLFFEWYIIVIYDFAIWLYNNFKLSAYHLEPS